MTTERIYEFLVLSQELNFKRAAQQMFMTQSILSRHIMEMEQEFGFKLFIRDTRNVMLTEAGKRLAEDLAKVNNTWEATMVGLRAKERKVMGRLSIGCTEGCVSAAYMDFIRGFMRSHPDIDVHNHVTQGPMPPGRWIQYDFFFSPCVYPNTPNHFEVLGPFHQPALLAFPPEHPFAQCEKLSLTQLAGEVLLVPCADELFGPFAKNKQLAEKCTSGNVQVVTCPSIPTALLLAEMGQGVTIMPPSLIKRDNRLHSCGIAERECHFDLYIYTNTKNRSYLTQLFREELLGACAGT